MAVNSFVTSMCERVYPGQCECYDREWCSIGRTVITALHLIGEGQLNSAPEPAPNRIDFIYETVEALVEQIHEDAG